MQNCHYIGTVGGIDYGYSCDVIGYPVEIKVPDSDLTLVANLDLLGLEDSGNTSGLYWRSQVVSATSFPTWTNADRTNGAFLGNDIIRPFYTGVAGDPALYQRLSGGGPATTVVSLKDIQVWGLDDDGSPSAQESYSIVVADAESTDSGESITWTKSGNAWPFTLIPNDPADQDQPFGNACGGGFTNNGVTAECVGLTTATAKTGTPMLSVNGIRTPWSLTQTMVGSGLEGVAFALQTGGVQAEVIVKDRLTTSATDDSTVADESDFTVSLEYDNNTYEQSTGATALEAETPVRRMLIPEGGAAPVQMGLSADSAALDSYTQSWTCTTTLLDGSELEQTFASPPEIQVGVNEFVHCQVVLTPPYLTLQKTVDSTGVAQVDLKAVPSDWGLSAAADLGSALGPLTPDTSPLTGSTEKYPVWKGTYVLSETAHNASANNGYQLDSLTCTSSDASVTSPAVTVGPGNDVTCTFTNKAIQPELTLVKVLKGGGSATIGQWTLSASGQNSSTSLSGASGSDAVTEQTVEADSYDLTESVLLNGYLWTDLACEAVDGGLFSGSFDVTRVQDNVTGASVTLFPGDKAVCTFTNTAIQPTLTLVKEVDNANAPDPLGSAADRWILTATPQALPSQPVVSGKTGTPSVTTVEVKPGDYSLTEAGLSVQEQQGYAWSELSCAASPNADFPFAGSLELQREGTDAAIVSGDLKLEAGDDVVCTYTNTARPGSVAWAKVDSVTGSLLSGSEWTLRGPDGASSVTITVTDCISQPCSGPDVDPAAGKFAVEDLKWGNYTLIESKAPVGYLPSEKSFEFVIGPQSGGFDLNVQLDDVQNTPRTGPHLPLTGGTSATMIALVGLGIIGGAGVLGAFKRWQKVRGTR